MVDQAIKTKDLREKIYKMPCIDGSQINAALTDQAAF